MYLVDHKHVIVLIFAFAHLSVRRRPRVNDRHTQQFCLEVLLLAFLLLGLEKIHLSIPYSFRKHMILTYRRKIVMVFWGDPGQYGGSWGPFLVITLKFQFAVKCWKVDFLMSSKTRSCQSSREKSCVCSVRSSRTPLDLANFNLNYKKKQFLWKTRFFQVH